MAEKTLPCPTVLRQLLSYNAQTGKLFWRKKMPWMIDSDKQSTQVRIAKNWNARYSGVEAFVTPNKNETALTGCINIKRLYAHRVAYAIQYGMWPKKVIDHINGNPFDNRIENLRDVTPAENSQNAKLYYNNKTGTQGVWWDKQRKNYQVYITKNQKRICLGRFKTLEEAVTVRLQAEKNLGFHSNHGRRYGSSKM
jgi:hypothetical protein